MRPRVLTLCITLLLACAGVALAQDTIRCESNDGRRRFCDVGPNREIRFARQASESPCNPGGTYGIERNGVWVDRGCRADFQVFRGGPGPGPDGRFDGDRRPAEDMIVRCESQDMHLRSCPTPGPIRRARLIRQISESECRQGYSWGSKRDSIWVNRGCRAEFEVELRSGPPRW